jgi:hypothetical protein
MKTVSARQANHDFSDLLSRVMEVPQRARHGADYRRSRRASPETVPRVFWHLLRSTYSWQSSAAAPKEPPSL